MGDAGIDSGHDAGFHNQSDIDARGYAQVIQSGNGPFRVFREGDLADFRLLRMRARRHQVEADSPAALLATIAEGGELAWTPITANDAYLRWLDEECSAT